MKEQLRVQKLIWRTMKLTFYQFVLMVLFAGIASAVTTNGQDLLNKEITIRSDGQDLKSILKSIKNRRACGLYIVRMSSIPVRMSTFT